MLRMALALVAIAFAAQSAFADGQSVYTDYVVDSVVEGNVDCAASILAVGQGSELATTIATFFILDAAQTLHTLGGWVDERAAQESVQGRVSVMMEDRLYGLDNTRSRQELLEHQSECVLSHFARNP